MTSGSAERWYRVGTVARMAGVTVRTLHHYETIGLVVPSGRSPVGYRRYTDADLDRLARALTYRELGFPLVEITALLDDPAIDRTAHLRMQRDRLREQADRLQAMLRAVEHEMEAVMTGIDLTSEEKLEIFGAAYDLAWEVEAEERWGGTEAWRQSQARVSTRTRADWQRMTAEMNAMHQRLVAGFEAGMPPDSDAVMNLAETHRQWVSSHWDCSPEAHVGLAEMYVADERFTDTYEAMAEGLTVWLHAAIVANAARQTSTL